MAIVAWSLPVETPSFPVVVARHLGPSRYFSDQQRQGQGDPSSPRSDIIHPKHSQEAESRSATRSRRQEQRYRANLCCHLSCSSLREDKTSSRAIAAWPFPVETPSFPVVVARHLGPSRYFGDQQRQGQGDPSSFRSDIIYPKCSQETESRSATRSRRQVQWYRANLCCHLFVFVIAGGRSIVKGNRRLAISCRDSELSGRRRSASRSFAILRRSTEARSK
ncbi:hypothetical protein PUN28_009173 [Cardiocondyla obscurior]|uniref:Uncharacterized protein n=1 Tax=Cardiocondyla obscurior TaxID=286306 RepID=A0AAW2FVX7_9HYME